MSPATEIFQPLLIKHSFNNCFPSTTLRFRSSFHYPKTNLSVYIWNGVDSVVWETDMNRASFGDHFQQSLLWSCWWTVLPPFLHFTGINGSQIWVSVTWELEGRRYFASCQQSCISTSNLGMVFVTDVRVSCKGTSRACAKANSCHLFWPLINGYQVTHSRTAVLDSDQCSGYKFL